MQLGSGAGSGSGARATTETTQAAGRAKRIGRNYGVLLRWQDQ
jgi:hypothetical protein